jgi:hypothetical protein
VLLRTMVSVPGELSIAAISVVVGTVDPEQREGVAQFPLVPDHESNAILG